MTTATYEKLKGELKKELFKELSSLLVREYKDPEGEYRQEFIKKILKISSAKEHRYHQYRKKNFLKLIS